MKTLNFLQALACLSSFIVAGATASPLPVAPVGGDIYISDSAALVRLSADGTQTIIPTTVLNPSGIVFDQSGDVYLADSTTNTVVKIGPDGTQTTVASGLSDPQDLILDPAGNLYVANSGTNSVLKIAPNGSQTTFATGVRDPGGLAFDSTGNLFVSSKQDNAIVKISPDGTKSNFVSAGLNSPGGLAFDATGNLLIADTGSDTILSVDRDGNVSTRVGTGLNSPADVAVDALGNLLVANSGTNSVLKISPQGMITSVASLLNAPQFVVMAPGLHQLLNISTRGFVGTGSHVLIAGFIVRGTPDADLGQTTVLVRAIGPSIDPSMIPDTLTDPVLELHDSTGTLVATNDNWKDTQKAKITATGLAPTNDRESAIEATLPDGNYTAIVNGKNDTSGVALVEVYKVQETL